MDAATTPDLHVALQLGTQMVEAARLADWERVALLRSSCDDHIRHSWPANAQTREAYLALQEQHLGVATLVAQAREDVARQLRTVRGNHRALSAYLVASGGD